MSADAENLDQTANQDEGERDRPADDGLDADAKAEAESVAVRRVRLGLLLTEIGKENNIEVSEEDRRQAVFEEARRYPGQEQMVLEYFQKNPQAMQQISGPIFEDKVVDFILEMAKVTDVKIDTDTLYQVSDEKSATKKPASKKGAKKPAAKKSASKKSAAKKASAKKSAQKSRPAAKKASRQDIS